MRNVTASDHYLLDDQTPHQKVTGNIPNITEYLQFSWFDWLWYYDPDNPLGESLGRYLGPAQNCGEGYTTFPLTFKGKV